MKVSSKNRVQIFLVISFFLFFYDTAFIFLPTFLSGRKLSIIMLTSFALIYKKKDCLKLFSKSNKFLMIPIVTLVTILYLIINSYLRFGAPITEYSQLTTNIFYFVFFTTCIYLVYIIFDSPKSFAKIISIVHITQAIFVYICLVSLGFREIVANLLHQLGNLPLDTKVRIIGFSNTGGASVSLLLLTGLMAIGYLIIKDKKNYKLYFSQYIFVLFACFFVAKTGFYFGLLLLLFISIFIVITEKIPFLKTMKIFSVFLLIMSIISILLYLASPESFVKTAKLSLTFIQQGLNDPSINIFFNMRMPLEGVDLILGTSVFRGMTDTGVMLSHDSGFIRSIFSMGILLAGIFYLTHVYVFYYYINKKKSKTRTYLCLLFLVIIIVEVKEPFFFKDYLQIVPYGLVLLEQKKLRGVR